MTFIMLYLIKECVRSSLVFSGIYLRIFHSDRLPRRNQIAVCGFPRSGNTYVGRVVRRSLNDKVSLVNHFHSSAQLKRSIHLGIPSILVLRNVEDVLLSLHIGYYNNKGARIGLWLHFVRYLIYHISLLRYRKRMIIVRFDDVKNDVYPIIAIMENFHQFQCSNEFNLQDILDSIKSDMKPGNELKSSQPNQAKESMKTTYRPLINSHWLLPLVQYIYKKF